MNLKLSYFFLFLIWMASFGKAQAQTVPTSQITPIAAGSVVANATNSSAAPTPVSISSLLDFSFGSAPGEMLDRGASGWTVLAPGTTGQVLQTGGASAAPSWISLPATGQITATVVAAGSTTFTATPNSRYLMPGAGTIRLPLTSAVGDTIEVVGCLTTGSASVGNGVNILAGVNGQYIEYNNASSSTNGTGYLTTANGNSCVKITCTVANTGWVVTTHEQAITLY